MKRISFIQCFRILLPVLVVLAGASADGISQQDVSVESRLDKSVVTVGELVKYEIIIRFDPELQVAAPPAGINLGGFEIRDYEDHDAVLLDSVVVKRVEFTIAAYDTGRFVIPPTAIAYMTPDSVADVLYTDAVGIKVESVLTGEEADIKDIRSPVSIPFNWKLAVFLGGLVLFLAVSGFIGYRWYKKRLEGKSLFEAPKEPDRPAHELALEELEALKASSLIGEGRIKEYYIELSDILRMYLQRRYYRQFMEMTTTEIKDALGDELLDGPVREKISSVLEICDFVKFAKFRPEAGEHAGYLDKAFEIVDMTKVLITLSGPAESLEPAGEDEIEIKDDVTGEPAAAELPENADSDSSKEKTNNSL